MQARFTAEAENDVCWAFGTKFPLGKWVKADHLATEHQAMLRDNGTFETRDGPEAETPPDAASDGEPGDGTGAAATAYRRAVVA